MDDFGLGRSRNRIISSSVRSKLPLTRSCSYSRGVGSVALLLELAPPFRSLLEGRVFEIGPLVDR